MNSLIKDLLEDCKGATAVEYCLIAVLIVMGMVAGISALGNETSKQWDEVANAATEAGNP